MTRTRLADLVLVRLTRLLVLGAGLEGSIVGKWVHTREQGRLSSTSALMYVPKLALPAIGNFEAESHKRTHRHTCTCEGCLTWILLAKG